MSVFVILLLIALPAVQGQEPSAKVSPASKEQMIQNILDRITQLEDAVQAMSSSTDANDDNEECCTASTSDPVKAKASQETFSRIEIGSTADINSGECRCEDWNLIIYSDGNYTFTSTHKNRSGGLDDGDRHRVYVYVKDTNGRQIGSFEANRFVPKQQRRPLNTSGNKTEFREQFGSISSASLNLSCE
jgi:hypothetical protein